MFKCWGVVLVYKSQGTFLNLFHCPHTSHAAEVPYKRTVIKIWDNKIMVNNTSSFHSQIRAKISTDSCCDAFLQISEIWVSKFSIESKWTPKSLTTLSSFKQASPIPKEWMFSVDFLPMQIDWNVSGFAFIWLCLNHWIKAIQSLSKEVFNTLKSLFEPLIVLSSA